MHIIRLLQKFEHAGDTFFVITPDNSFEDILMHMVHEVDSSAEDLRSGFEELTYILQSLEEGDSV